MATEDIIKLLDEVRMAEITASIQYMAHHSELENLGVDKLAKQMKREAIEEMKHAEVLAERIFFLGGRPTHRGHPARGGAPHRGTDADPRQRRAPGPRRLHDVRLRQRRACPRHAPVALAPV